MKLYNTLTRKKEDFCPLSPNDIKIYICGPTVYNYMHLGNARPMVIFDTLRRFLMYNGYNIKYIQNFTDIDDKIIEIALEHGVNFLNISDQFICEFYRDIDKLNILRADEYPRVTEEIDEIINMIGELVVLGNAYISNGNVYFCSQKFKNYGKLSKKNIDELEFGNRILVDKNKKNDSDFVLWKKAKPNEPFWNSPWGDGRPGWHIECSAIIHKYLGKSIDIHAGGEDLIFPHHENEIAQSEACHGTSLAKYWLHNAMVNVDSQKMSKSSGNFFLIRQLLQKFDASVIRFFILSLHYRSPLSFSLEQLEQTQAGLERIKKCMHNLKDKLKHSSNALNKNNIDAHNKVLTFRVEFDNAMNDDINTANAITVLFDIVKFANKNMDTDQNIIYVIHDEIEHMLDILGVKLIFDNYSNEDNLQIQSIIDKRTIAKHEKNYALADELREQLLKMDVIIEDTRKGTTWKYKRSGE